MILHTSLTSSTVNLRNQLGVEGKTTRVEEGDEPVEFLSVLPVPLSVQSGQGTVSSFYAIEETGSSSVRLYRIHSGRFMMSVW
ncbi:hypothetical protein SARC_17384 [Sphaeroforma arctica JP610]|uniref:Uncharacterized protein n=1 Tax=Sphaeroforma arctica JP610 TaxID=667725 RepID=A0A0L0F052_9EUKA|nr:hypothetical protein SARC_17384 [Sphaeroforma arctica JP610]KNC70090.1 hypothetical protein SARC_17384 [Sphaeroforma arctica JP610]|eukprot:XP_014143992.1 hypothetical protein SARC_17384 [Sphaeroforma arctica JP610]